MYLFCINLGNYLENFVHLQRQILYDGGEILYLHIKIQAYS